MGFALAWIAVKGRPKQEILKQFDLRGTGEFYETFDSDFNGADRNQWYFVFGNGMNAIPLIDANYNRLSKGCEIIFCQVEERVMYSATGYWNNGKNIFFVSHYADKGPRNLEERGTFPEEYNNIRERLIKEQDRDDSKDRDPNKIDINDLPVDFIFDIPVELAAYYTGFRHDRWSEEDSFEVLLHKPPFYKKLLTRTRYKHQK